jgi:type IV pilus assembly protein PilO
MAKGFNDLPPRTQSLVLAVLALSLAGAIFWYYALPESTQLESLQHQVAHLKAENDRNEAFKSEQTEYRNRIAQLSEQLKTLRSIVPDEPATDAFIKSVYDTGVSSGVHIRTFVAEPQVSKELYVEMPFRLRLDGTYYRLLQFFDRLAHSQRIVTVSNLSLGSPGGGGLGSYEVSPAETVGANCVITTYYNQPQPVANPGGAKGANRARE